MMRHRTLALALASSLLAPASLAGQSLADRIADAGNGTVSFTYATRDGVCGDGQTFIAEDGPGLSFTAYTVDGSVFMSDGESGFRSRCVAGPARVVATMSGGRASSLRVFVGPSGGRSGRDLGVVSTSEAARWLVSVARTAEGRSGREAMLAAGIADSVRLTPLLAPVARDRSLRTEVREQAIRWLARAGKRDGDPQADETLRAIAGDDSDGIAVRERAIRAIADTDGGDRYLRDLYARLDETALRERVLRALGEVPSDVNRRFLREVVLDTRQATPLRERALRALAEEAHDGATVRELYARLDDPALRERAVRLIGEAGDEESVRWLRNIISDASAPIEVRERAVRLIGEHGSTAELRALYPRLTEPVLRERIVRLAGEAGGSDDLTFLRAIMNDERESLGVRERALRSLAEGGLPTPELGRLYDSLGERALRERIVRLLAERGDRPARDKLFDIARGDSDREMRRFALRRLSEMGDPRARELIERTIEQ